jgi:hypothetical protein
MDNTAVVLLERRYGYRPWASRLTYDQLSILVVQTRLVDSFSSTFLDFILHANQLHAVAGATWQPPPRKNPRSWLIQR